MPARPTRCRRPRVGKEGKLPPWELSLNHRVAISKASRWDSTPLIIDIQLYGWPMAMINIWPTFARGINMQHSNDNRRDQGGLLFAVATYVLPRLSWFHLLMIDHPIISEVTYYLFLQVPAGSAPPAPGHNFPPTQAQVGTQHCREPLL